METAFSSVETVGALSVAWLLVAEWSAWATEGGREAEWGWFFENSANSGYATSGPFTGRWVRFGPLAMRVGDDGKQIDASCSIT